jgi:hypothetical protein
MPITYTHATTEELFSMWSVPRCYNQEVWSSSVWESGKRGLELEAEE